MAINLKVGVADEIGIKKIEGNIMKKVKLIGIVGMPGTGKTTLMRQWIEMREWVKDTPLKLLDTMVNAESSIRLFGKYEEGEVFAGTDRLSMAVQPAMQEWIASHNCNVLFEGDRIFNQSFLEFCMGLPVDLQVVYLKVPQDMLTQRYADRGSDQSETFLKGRATKYNNILSNFELMSYITEFVNTNLEEQSKVLAFLENQTAK